MTDEMREVAIRVLIVCVAVTWLVVLWRADRNEAFRNFTLLGFVQTKEGFPDRVAFMELGTWGAFTLLLFILASHDKFTEYMALIYVAFPAVRAGQVAWLRSGTPTPASSTVTTDTGISTVKTVTQPATPKGESP